MPKKAAVLGLLILAAALFYSLDLHRYTTLAGLKAHHAELAALYARRPLLVVAGFMLAQIAALALALPGAVLSFALAGGALFGAAWGTAIVLTSITLGDSLGFLLARYLFRGWMRRRFADRLESVNHGVERDGAFYLLALRLMAVVPFFVVNVTMALTRMPLRVFAPVSFVGLVPATALYVAAGTALGTIDSVSDIASPRLVAILAALGLLPVVACLAFRKPPSG